MRCLRAHTGFTLIEIIVVVAVLSLVMIGIYLFFTNVFRLSREFNNAMATQQELNTTLKEFAREVRTMTMSEGGAYPIQEASSTSFTFFTDYDKDGTIERVRYFYSTTTGALMKGIIEPVGGIYSAASETISTRVSYVTTTATTTPMFTYYGSSYDGVGTTTPLSTPVDIPSIRHIRAYVVIIPGGPNQRATSTVVFSTQVTPRNIKDNL